MSTQQVPLYPTNIDPFNTVQRRVYISAYLQNVWKFSEDDEKSLRADAVLKFCAQLTEKKVPRVGIVFFEYFVDRLTWKKAFFHLRSTKEDPKWPWAEFPEFKDMSAGISSVYQQYRLDRKLPIIPEKKADNAPTEELTPAERTKVEASEARFAAETAKLETAKRERPDCFWTDGPEESVDTPIIPLSNPLPYRRDYMSNSEDPLPTRHVPEETVRNKIWVEVFPDERVFTKPVCGPFELTLPEHLDFHALVYDREDDFVGLMDDHVLDHDLTISWILGANGRPVSLVVGPTPEASTDKQSLWRRLHKLWRDVLQWAAGAYKGDCLRLGEHLCICHRLELTVNARGVTPHLERDFAFYDANKALAKFVAKRNTEDWEQWAPEVYAILKQPSKIAMKWLGYWVHREGPEAAKKRVVVARDIWGYRAEDPNHACKGFTYCNEMLDTLHQM